MSELEKSHSLPSSEPSDNQLREFLPASSFLGSSPRSLLRKLAIRLIGSSIDPSTFVHPSARIGREVEIGANCFIGEDAVIENRVKIGPNCYVGRRCKIGRESSLQDNVVLTEDVTIGACCVLGDDFLGTDHKAKIIGKSSTLGRSCTILGKVFIGVNCCMGDFTSIGDQNIQTVVGENVILGVDVQARGWVPSGLQIKNCGAIFGEISPDKVAFNVSTDWWVASGLVSPHRAAEENHLTYSEWLRNYHGQSGEILRAIEKSLNS